MQRVSDLSDDAALGLFIASFVLGGTCWNSLIPMVAKLDLERRESIY